MENKKDPWKSIIEENKDAFNQKKPGDLWNSIEKELDQSSEIQPKTIELWKVYRIAAILIVVVGLGFFVLFQNNESQPMAELPVIEEPQQQYPQELLEVENFYASEIEDKLDQVKKLTDDNIAVQEIQLLREEFDKLKLEIGDNVNDEKVIEAMIMNYRLRLDLLKEILSDLQPDERSSTKKMNYEEI